MFEAKVNSDFDYPVVTLYDTDNDCEVEIFAYGALLNKFIVTLDYMPFNVIEAYKNVDDAVTHLPKFFSSARLSPFTCRLNNGKFIFNKDEYKIEKFYLGKHAIHGIVYDGLYDVAETGADSECAWTILKYYYDGSDEGYPFAYTSQIKYSLYANNVLMISVDVEHDNVFAIPYAEGWHPYFNLDIPVDECTLQINADTEVKFDNEMIPTGAIISNTTYSSHKKINNTHLDNCFVLDENKEQPVIELKSDKLCLTIVPDKAYPYVQVFTPDHRKNIAIENLSAPPDAFNNKMSLLLLEPNKQYNFTATYSVAVL